MSRAVYNTTRDLHLHPGPFISRFVQVFAISVFFLVHTWVPGGHRRAAEQSATGLRLPPDLDKRQNAGRVRAARKVMNQLQVTGEVGLITHVATRHLLEIPVFVAGRETANRSVLRLGFRCDIDARDGSGARVDLPA